MVRRRGPLRALQKTPVALLLTGNTVAAARHIVDLQWCGFLHHSRPIFTFIIGRSSARCSSISAEAYFGGLIGLRYQIVAMFIPLAILIALPIYSAIRPFVRLPEEEW
jgi:uncharacterized membrane protein YoaK (UPF0700 family)